MNPNTSLKYRTNLLLINVKFQNYKFIIRESHGGVFLQGTYNAPDTYTGEPQLQQTRKWLLSPEMTDSEIVSTVFKCCITSMEHRCREDFTYKGSHIFGPHLDIEDLVKLCWEGRETAGGRKNEIKELVS